jgi:hypothetical protein
MLNIRSRIDRIRQARIHIGGLKCNLRDPIDKDLAAMLNGKHGIDEGT